MSLDQNPLASSLPFVCVLKSGGSYRPRHVQELVNNIRQFNPTVRIICLSDLPLTGIDVERVTLKHNLKGWFSKLEIFGLDEPRFLYLDLDVTVTGPIDVSLGAGLFILRGFNNGSVNSSVMYVDGSFRPILDRFLSNKEGYSIEYTAGDKWGDQDFIRDFGDITGYLQDHAPGLAASWKRDYHCQMGWIAQPPRILVFHGHPKPDELTLRHDPHRGLYVFSWRYWPKSLLKQWGKQTKRTTSAAGDLT